MKTLRQMANELGWLTQCDGLRKFFDPESSPDTCVYDSAKIFNFFTCCEEVASYIEDGKYKEAEEIIDCFTT